MSCDHSGTHISRTFTDEFGNMITVRMCVMCGADLPLGPSNDEPKAVQIEMAAAERATTPWCIGALIPPPYADSIVAHLAREIFDNEL